MEDWRDDVKSIAAVRSPRGLIKVDREEVRPWEDAALGGREVEGHVRSLGELEAQVVIVKEPQIIQMMPQDHLGLVMGVGQWNRAGVKITQRPVEKLWNEGLG